MVITNSKRIIIKQIMYSLPIAITSLLGDDGITAQFLHCFQSYLLCQSFLTDIVYNMF